MVTPLYVLLMSPNEDETVDCLGLSYIYITELYIYIYFGQFSCDTKNVIYLISCQKCGKAQYVGQTQNSLRERFYLHRSHIGKNVGTPLTIHFNQSNHTLEDMRCNCSLNDRLKRENFWISKLKTMLPHGLNV